MVVLEITELLVGVVVLEEEIFNSFHIWRITVSKNENFPIFNILAYE